MLDDFKIYVASRASVPARAAMWRDYRKAWVPINSTWIDEDGPGQTVDFRALWNRIGNEIAAADVLILYAEPGDFPLKGALVEAGLAIGMMKPVFVVLPGVRLDGRTDRPIGSWIRHPMVTIFDDVLEALDAARRLRAGDTSGLGGDRRPVLMAADATRAEG